MRGVSRALARRYARALLDVSERNPTDGAPQAVRDELTGLRSLLAEHKDLSGVLQNPALPAEAKKKVVAAVARQTKIQPVVHRLMEMLAARDRIALLPAIAEAFQEAWNERRGVTSAEAVSAVELLPAQRDALTAALARAAGRAVELRTRIDPQILGGLVVNMGGKTYDGSVRGRLAALRQSLLGRTG
jgi:F-type H+-transporting ATPase subunit delta